MDKIKISEEIAVATADKILEHYELEKYNFPNYKALISLLKNGRLQFTDNQQLLLNLFTPIKNNDGQLTKQLTMNILTGQVLIDAEKNNRNDIEQGMFYISSSADMPLGSIYTLSTRDIRNCQVVISLFL